MEGHELGVVALPSSHHPVSSRTSRETKGGCGLVRGFRPSAPSDGGEAIDAETRGDWEEQEAVCGCPTASSSLSGLII